MSYLPLSLSNRLAASACLVFACLIAQAPAPASASELVPLTVGQSDANRYGYRFEGISNRRVSAAFTFEGGSETLTLTATGYDIDLADEVSIWLNGTRIGYLTGSPNLGTAITTLPISANDQTNGTNTLEFRQQQDGWHWGVTDILLTPDSNPDTSSVELIVGLSDAERYGNHYANANSRETSAVFTFDGGSDILTLTVTGYDIDTVDEVAVLVNGTEVGYLAVSPNNETELTSQPINVEVQQNGTNTLEFRERTSGWRWGVTNIMLTLGCNYPLIQN